MSDRKQSTWTQCTRSRNQTNSEIKKAKRKLLKMAASIVSTSLTLIFANSIETGIFPDEWKLARMTPIFKKAKRDEPNNYRPISVIPTVAKIFEKCQISEYLNANNLLSHCQSGFRSLHSTLTALVDDANSWSVNIDNGLVNGVVFIDLKKAFDTIDHNIFLRKWRKSYLLDRSQRSSLAGQLSYAALFSCGMPQGGNLGPLLFLVYVNDLPNCLRLTSLRMFADDTNITFAASTWIDLENGLNSELRSRNQCLFPTN